MLSVVSDNKTPRVESALAHEAREMLETVLAEGASAILIAYDVPKGEKRRTLYRSIPDSPSFEEGIIRSMGRCVAEPDTDL